MIKRFLAAAIALLLLTTQVLASDWLINSYRLASTVADAVDISLTDDSIDTANASQYTFSTQSFGSEVADRIIAVSVHTRSADGAILETTSVTIGGVRAEFVVSQNNAGSGNDSHVSIWQAKVPTGTTGTVVVNISGAPGRCAITVHRITGAHLYAHDTLGVDASDPSGTIDIPANGAGLAASFSGANTSVTWTGLTEDVDATVESQTYSSATGEFASTQTGLTVTSDFGSNTESVMAAASWGPSSVPLSNPTLTFLQCSTENGSNLTTYTFASQNTGTAGNNRVTIVAATGEDSAGTFNIASVTVGGHATSSVVQANSSSAFVAQGIFNLVNPVGTSESIVVTFSEAITSARVCLWAATDLSSLTAVDTATDEVSGGSSLTLDTDVSANGVAVGIVSTSAPSASYAWEAGLTERADDGTGEHSMTVADFTNDGSADTPLAITCNPSTGLNSGPVASFR